MANDEYYGRIREEAAKRKAAAEKGPTTAAQLKYRTRLADKVSKQWFDAGLVKAVKGTDIKPRAPTERTATASKQLTKAAAHKLIGALGAS